MTKLNLDDLRNRADVIQHELDESNRIEKERQDREFAQKFATLIKQIECEGIIAAKLLKLARVTKLFENPPRSILLSEPDDHRQGITALYDDGRWGVRLSHDQFAAQIAAGLTPSRDFDILQAMGVEAPRGAMIRAFRDAIAWPEDANSFQREFVEALELLPPHVRSALCGASAEAAREFNLYSDLGDFKERLIDAVLASDVDRQPTLDAAIAKELAHPTNIDEDAVYSLLKRGAMEPNASIPAESPVWKAVARGRVEFANMLIVETGFDVGAVNEDDETLLHVAARSVADHPVEAREMILRLIELGAEPESRNGANQTSAEVAAIALRAYSRKSGSKMHACDGLLDAFKTDVSGAIAP